MVKFELTLRLKSVLS